ncbi:MAG: hypothetical protein ACKOAL_09415 [Chthoniobacterales bacterium]
MPVPLLCKTAATAVKSFAENALSAVRDVKISETALHVARSFSVRRGCRMGLLFVILFISVFSLSGCAMASYGIGVGTMVADMKTRQREDYARYRAQTESSGQTPLSFRQWLRGQEG